MGTFTSKYKVNDGSLFGRTETRVDAGKSIDAGATVFLYLVIATIGIWFSFFLWLIFKTLKEPENISYKDMQQYGIDTKPILDAKKKAWILMIVTFPIAPLSGLLFYRSKKSKLGTLLEVTKEFNDSFINSYNYAINEKKQIINNAVSTHGRDSEEYKNIAQQELNDLIKSIEDEFYYSPKIMKTLEEKTKLLLNINFPTKSIISSEEEVICSLEDVEVTNKYFMTVYRKIPLSNVKVFLKREGNQEVFIGIIAVITFMYLFGIPIYDRYTDGGFNHMIEKYLPHVILILFSFLWFITFAIKRHFNFVVKIGDRDVVTIRKKRKTKISKFYDCVKELSGDK